MPAYRFVLHPGVGQAPTSDGTERVTTHGTNVTFLEVPFINGADKESHFHGVVVPVGLITGEDAEFVAVFRQTSAGSGNVRLDVETLVVGTPSSRDQAFTSLTAQNVAVPGTLGNEFSATFALALAAISAGEEILTIVKREGTNAADTFAGDIALVRLEIIIPAHIAATSGTWDSDHITLGAYHIWVDGTGDLRIKSGAPASATDGVVVGTQT